jgi:hypothetical protein
MSMLQPTYPCKYRCTNLFLYTWILTSICTKDKIHIQIYILQARLVKFVYRRDHFLLDLLKSQLTCNLTTQFFTGKNKLPKIRQHGTQWDIYDEPLQLEVGKIQAVRALELKPRGKYIYSKRGCNQAKEKGGKPLWRCIRHLQQGTGRRSQWG